MKREFSTVKALCEARSTPFHIASIDNGDFQVARKRLVAPEPVDLHGPYVYCGLVEDVHIFGRTFLHSNAGAYVTNCQSYQGYQDQAVDDCIAQFIEACRE